MAKKQFFAIIDTETTVNNTVADIGIVICDRNGIIQNQMGVLVKSHFDEYELFYDKNAKGIWSREYAAQKRKGYEQMLDNGSRMLASVNAINMWIQKAIGKYDPILTAYNLAFDVSKCHNTGIDLSGFSDKFCLWQAAVGNICQTKKFKNFVLQNHRFNTPTDKGNMTFQTNAEVVCGYLQGSIQDEPHTALEDAVHFELPILQHILKKKNWRDNIQPYDWNQFQVRDHFKA